MLNTQNRTQAKKQPPITSHPLFPAIVALWFGALFGLGSLAVRPSLIESFVISSHIDVLVPMAAPPLGITSRILLALFMAAIGVAAGAILARRITRPKPVERARRRSAANVASKDKTSRYNAPDEDPYGLNSEKPEGYVAPSSRRRALQVEPQVQEAYLHDAAPLPGGAPSILDITQFDLDTPPAVETAVQAELGAAAQPLDLDSFPEPETAAAAPLPVEAADQADCLILDEQAQVPAQAAASLASEAQTFAQPDRQMFHAPASFAAPAPEVLEPGFELIPELSCAFDAAPPEAAAATPQAAPALPAELRRFDGPAAAETPVMPTPEPAAFTVSEVSAPAPIAGPAQPQDANGERLTKENLAELSPVELIERFARALQAKRHSGAFPPGLAAAAAAFAAPAAQASAQPAMTSAPPPEVPAPAPVPVAFDEAETAAAEVPAGPLTLPAALRPLDFSDYEDYDEHPSYVPARSINLPAAGPVEAEPAATAAAPLFAPPVAAQADSAAEDMAEDVAEAESDVPEESYSSLLDLARPAPLRQTFVRIDEPEADSVSVEPVVIFPGQDAPLGTRFGRPDPFAAPAAAQLQQPEAAEASAPETSVSPMRRFDAPTPASAPQDPAEAERALRSALATLQRMSGAA